MRKKADTVRMLELREQGLSNAQIALEMGISKKTVFDHIGPLGKGRVARHGSLVTHAQGESFVNKDVSVCFEGFRPCSKRVEEEEARKIDNPCVFQIQETKRYKGKDLTYILDKKDEDERVTIYFENAISDVSSLGIGLTTAISTNKRIEMSFDECQQMIMELLELIG